MDREIVVHRGALDNCRRIYFVVGDRQTEYIVFNKGHECFETLLMAGATAIETILLRSKEQTQYYEYQEFLRLRLIYGPKFPLDGLDSKG